MSIETFDWQGYMSDIGYAPEEIPNEINDEDREWLYGLWARDLMEQLNYEAKQNPFLATSKEKANEARRQFLEYAPDLAHYFGEEVQPNNPNATFDPEEFRQHVVNNEVQNANLGYYLDTFAASRINEDTDVKWPWLKGLTKDQFKKSFMEQQDIDEAWTSVDDIRNGNFGTLAANYQAQLAQQQGLRGDEKSGHMAALKQGWYEFEKLFGYTAGTLGDATGIQWLSDIGNEIAQNVIQKSDAYNYQSKYNQSLADTIKNEGVMAAGGKILNMAEENWATTAAPLALAAIGKILSTYAHVPQPLADAATRAVAANVVRRQGANLLRRASQLAYGSSAALSGLEIGGVRAELEEKGKYDPNNVADVVAAGLVSSSLDFIGNVAAMKGLTITAGRLWRSNLATMEARSRLAKEIAEDQAKSFTHRVLSAMATEGVTEGLQEIPAMVVGARRGIEYTPKEVRDRIIDAAAVGAFMGGGIRAGEIALEKYHRGDEESPTDTDADETPETPDAPETPPQPSQPPPPDFDGEMPFNNVTYRQMENGFVAADPFNVGYGATRNEAAEDFLKNANKGRVDIDANDIRSVPSSATGEGSSIVRYGNNGEHSVRIIGQGSNALIRKIIDIHNNPKNAVNLQGHNTFNVSDFQSTNPDLNEDQFIRSVLEQKKTGRGSSNDVILNRTNAVDIPVNLTAVPRTDIAGDYAAFNLDNDTRDALRRKGFRVLSNPRTYDNGRRQKLLLYRDGFVYTVTLRNSATDDNVSATVEADNIKDIVARNQLPKKEQRDKRREANVKRNALEAGVKEQILRTVSTDAVTDISTTVENKSSITIAPVLRAGFVELSRKMDAQGVSEISIDPREILKKRVENANGKIEKIGARGLTYTSGGETTRLDITADGRVVVSTDGRFVGDYFFFDPADLTEGELRASFQSTRIEATQPFNVIDIPEELQFDGRVMFVYEGDANTPENERNYYGIRNNGDVYYLSPADENYVKRLLKLQYIQNLNDARDVFGNQFIEFYALPSFYEDGDVNQFVGFKTENNLLPAVNLEDPTLHRFSNMEVDDLISAGYNADFVKVYAIIAPNGEVVRATTEEGVDTFIEDIKDYANILDDSEWNPSSRGESIFGDAYTERGLYTEEDLYGVGYETSPSDDNVTDDDISKDNEKIREATKKIVDQIGQQIKALRDQHKKGKYHLSNSRISEYESVLSDLERDIAFSESSTFNYYPGTVREINENLRRRFYAMRTAQAMLHIDLYRNKLGSYTSVLNREELDRVLANTSLTFNENATIEELRRNTIQVESIAVRLEEAYIKTFPLNDSTKLTTLLWQTIYSDPVEGNYGSFVNRIHSEGTDFRFSRAVETPRVRRKDSILNELQRELGDFTLNEMLEKGLRGESGGLVILPDQEAAHNIERMFTTDATQPYYDDEGLIQGFVAPDGMIYLVEDGIVDGKARQIILHEYGVHARKFGMTDAQFQEVVQNIKAKRDEKSLEGDFVRHAITRAKQANKNMSEDNPIFWEEVAAYAVEDGYHLADTGIVGRMQTWMKNWLWRFGVIDATAFHYQDFVNMAQGMLGNPGPLSFFDGTHDYTKYQDTWKNIPKFSRTILAEDTPEREEFAQRTYRRLRGLDDAIERERNGEDADTIEQATDWRRNDQGDWEHDQLSLTVPRISEETGITIVSDIAPEKPLPEGLEQFGNYNQFLYSIAWHATPNHVEEFADYLAYLGSGQGSQVHGIGIYAMLGDSEERRLENWRKYGGGDNYDRRDFIENTIRVRNLSSRMNDVKFFKKLGKLYNFDNYSVYELDIPGLDKYYIAFQSSLNSRVTSDYSDSYFITENIRTVKKGTIEFIDPRERAITYGDNLTFEEYLSSELLAFNTIENRRTGRTNTSSNSTKNLVGSINRYWLHVYEKGEKESNKFDNLLTSLGLSHDDFFVSEQDINENLPDIGQQYKLNVPNADTEMLQEDKKLNDQPKNIKKAIGEIWNSIQNSLPEGRDRESYRNFLDIHGMGKHKTAREYYLVLAEALYQIKHGTLQGSRSKSGRSEATIMATQALREAGIKGIHYFGRGDGDCVVIFDGSDVEVLQTYFPPRKGINPKTGEPFRYSRATAEDLKPYSSFISTLENDLVSQRISGVPREGDTVLYQRGDVNEFITRDSLYTVEDAADYHPDLEQRWIDYHRDDSESNFVRYSRSIPETNGFRYSFAGEIGAAALDAYEEVTIRMDNLAVAREMERAGKDAKTVKLATGWERGKDGKWRYEIDDSGNKVSLRGDLDIERTQPDYRRYRELDEKFWNDDAGLSAEEMAEYERLGDRFSGVAGAMLDKVWNGRTVQLRDVLDAPELFKAYPDLRHVTVQLRDDLGVNVDGAIGKNAAGDLYIFLRKSVRTYPEERVRSILHHEVQHAVQEIEGFASGGNGAAAANLERQRNKRIADIDAAMQTFYSTLADIERTSGLEEYRAEINRQVRQDEITRIEANDKLREWIAAKSGLREELDSIRAQIARLQDEKLSAIQEGNERRRSSVQTYHSLAGEVEARNTSRRLNMTPEERRTSLASETEDVAREDQIVLENMLNEASSAIRYSRTMPTGEQKQAGVLYPDASEEIQAIRYSRQSVEEILKEKRPDFTSEQMKVILDKLDSYEDDEKKKKLVLHWVVKGKVILPEDDYKIDPAIKYASNLKIDPYTLSPQEIINRYQKSKPEGMPIRPGQLKDFKDKEGNLIFTDPINHGDGILSYQVQNSKEGQEAMRKIINTHWGKSASPWCLLYANNQGELNEDSWIHWENYSGLPKRVAFKRGNLISFMATKEEDRTLTEALEEIYKRYNAPFSYFIDIYPSENETLYQYSLYDTRMRNVNGFLSFAKHFPKRLKLTKEELQKDYFSYLLSFAPQSISDKVKDFIRKAGEDEEFDWSQDREEWLSFAEKAAEDAKKHQEEAKDDWKDWVRNNAVNVSYGDDGIVTISNWEGKPIDNHIFGEGSRFKFDEKYNEYYVLPDELWWDRDDRSHPDLDWARDTSVSGLRYSRAATIDDVPQTARQRGTQVPNAPGMYKMPDGSLHIEPSELPVGFESETILYAAISVSDPAKEEPKIAELRGLIAVDEDLMRETDRMMRERNDTNEDHRLGYAVSLILEAYDPTSDIYQQTVDAFHEAVSKATGGAYQNLILDTGQIEAAAHAAAGIPYEALLTAPQETVPTPRPDTADVQRQQLEEAFANSDAQREYMQVGEDGRPFIATDDSDVDVIFESKVTNPFTTGELADKVLVETTEHNEPDDFYNHLADSPHHGTQEPLDTGRFTAQADTMRNEVEAFLASVLPEHIWNRMQILWEDNAENRKLLGNALGNFNIKAWQNKNILVRGWDRSFGQVVRTAAREASRFGWGLWQNRDFRKALTDFYDMYTARIHEELRPYYNQKGVTDPTKLTNGQKIFMVQTFFSKLNQSLFTDDATNMADILGIDAQEYKRVLANVRRGISAQENDLSPFMQGVAGDPELAKQFAREMLRMTMETATNVGTHFVYERANTLGGKDRIHVYTNEWGTWRNTESKTRFGEVAQQIKENLEWWRNRYKGSPRMERFARWMMRNAPIWMKYPFKWMHLYVPSARLGDTTLGRASQMISRVWQRIGDMSGTTIQQDYALMEDIHGILRDHGYDPLVANDMFDQAGRRITYEQFFRGLGITSAKAMEKARLADEVVRTAEQLRKEQAANIRSIIVETGVSLYNRMVNAGVPERNIKAMVNNFETKRQRYHDNYSHRMYEAFMPEGKSELSRMLHYLKRDPATGELTIAKRARQAEEKIRQAEARYGRGTSQFYKETVEARADLRRYERLTHLQNFVKAVLRDKKRLFGAEFNEAVVAEMKNTINAIVLDAQSIGRVDTQAVPHYNSIAAQKARKLDPSKAHHRELMAFLSEIKDPMRIAVYSADQQRQIIAKLQFNKELGEYLVDNNMASVRGVPNTESIARDLAQMESGTFLEYINVDPEFMPEIKAEWENMQKVTETVLAGVTDAVKANSTVYSLRLAMNNYIGNASMLLASGHFWRFGNWMEAGGIVRKQFLDRFTYGAKDPSDFGKMIIKEMEDAMVTGGSGTEMSVFQLNKGAHENFVQMMTELLYGKNLITRAGKFKTDNFVKRALEYARKFYTYGDEWVKPLMYINNRMNAIAKYKAIEKRQNGETEEEYNERVLKKAIEEASEMTIRETVSWENSPFFVRQLSTKSVRFFVPDFLLHNFQMLRITASNYVRLWELGRELLNFNPTEMNPDKVEEYRSALRKEFAQRSVGGAMTAGVYAGLAGATGSCMAFIPYMMNTLMAAIDGEDDKDKDNTFFNPQQWEGAQRILNYKTGGDNFFVPAWMHDGKIYAWNYGRASVMLTHAIPQPATENPEFTDYAAQFFKNIVNIGGGTIAQEIVNNFQGKDKWGRDIGIEAGWSRIADRVIVPGVVRQLLDMSVGYPGSSDNPYREGKAIKMSDAVGITVNAYDMRDIVNELGWDMGRVGSNSQNVVRKSFVKRLTQSDALSDSDIASMVSDMREDNARHMDRANYLLTGLRQMGMENKDIQHWLTISRKDANPILSKKQATAFLKGHNVYDDALVTYLKNRRNNLAKGKDDVRMSGEELATVLQNYDKAIRIYSQALRAQ